MRLEPLAALVALCVAAPAAAQRPDPIHTQSIGAGVQSAAPYRGGGATPGVQVSWRRWLSPRFGIGADVRWWHDRTTTPIDTPAQNGPGPIVVPSMRGSEDLRVTSYGVGASAMARGSTGRLTLIGGAGPAFFVDRRAHATRINDWHSEGGDAVRSLGVHALAELEARLTGRLAAFAALRMELRDIRDLESSSGYPAAGLRIAF